MAADGRRDETDRPGVFKGLSMAQVIAGALASVTSMLLTEQVGIAGGIIGVVVSSVAYTVTAKVYGNMLAKSGERLRDHLGSDSAEEPGSEPLPSSAMGPRAQATRRVALDSREPAARTAAGGRIAPPALRAQAASKRRAELQRKVIVVSVVVALAAVGASALVVSLLTAGNGLGPKASQVTTTASVTASATTKAATAHAATTSTATSSAKTSAATQGTTAGSASDEGSANEGESTAQKETSGQSANTSAATPKASQNSAASTATASSPAAATTSSSTKETSE